MKVYNDFTSFFSQESEEVDVHCCGVVNPEEVPTCVDPEDTATVIDDLGEKAEDLGGIDIDIVDPELKAEIEAIEKSIDPEIKEVSPEGEFPEGGEGTPDAPGGLDLDDDTEVTNELYEEAKEYAEVPVIEVTGDGETVDEFLREEFEQIERGNSEEITQDPINEEIIDEEDVENLHAVGGDTNTLEEVAHAPAPEAPEEVSADEITEDEEALPGVGEMTGAESEEVETEAEAEVEEEAVEEVAEEIEAADDEVEEESELAEEHEMIDNLVIEIVANPVVDDIEVGEEPTVVEVEVGTQDDAFSDVSEMASVNTEDGNDEAVPLHEGEERVPEPNEPVEEVEVTEEDSFAEEVAPENDEISTDEDGYDSIEDVEAVVEGEAPEEDEPEVVEEVVEEKADLEAEEEIAEEPVEAEEVEESEEPADEEDAEEE